MIYYLADMNPWEFFEPYFVDMFTAVPLLGTMLIGIGIVIYMLKKMIKRS